MKIRIERSGGLAGIITSKEIEAKNLPSFMADRVHEIFNDKQPNQIKMSMPKGAADHFNYKIIIQDGRKSKVIECNEYNLKHDLKEIVNFVESHSK